MKLMTLTGVGLAVVCCEFTVSNDGDIHDLTVLFDEVDIAAAISDEQRMDLEIQCMGAYREWAATERDNAAFDRGADAAAEIGSPT